MFIEIVQNLEKSDSLSNTEKLVYYLKRHIELDAGEHGPMALTVLHQLCGNDQQKWGEVISISKKALEMRHLLWDGIYNTLSTVEAKKLSTV